MGSGFIPLTDSETAGTAKGGKRVGATSLKAPGSPTQNFDKRGGVGVKSGTADRMAKEHNKKKGGGDKREREERATGHSLPNFEGLFSKGADRERNA